MQTNIKRLIAGVTVLAVASVGLISTAASAILPLDTTPNGVATISPTSGTSATTLTILPPSGTVCPGDSASGGYRWQTFIVPSTVNAGTLTYSAGPVAVAPNTFALPLFSAAGSPTVDKNTAVTTGLITGIPTYSFAAIAGAFTTGQYKIGYACTKAGVTESFWQTIINVTVTAGAMSFSPFEVPGAPTLASPLTSGNGTLAGTYTAPAATPAATSFTVTATSAGNPTVTVAGSAGAFTLTGLVNKSAYSVTVTQTNAAGTSVASNAVVGTPADPNERPAVTAVVQTQQGVANGAPEIISWTAPTTAPVSGQYTVAVTNAGTPIAGSPFTVSATTVSIPCTPALAGVLLTAVVTPVWAAPLFAPSATTTFACGSATTVTQDITVTRPVGGLVLTQTCAKYGALPAEPTSLGFDAVLPAELASGTGSAPTINDPRTIVDPAFSQYPYPVDAIEVPNPTYPTHCALNLGLAKLITSGSEAGKYFKVDGRISQVAIVDTRDTDAGWVVSGKVSDFASGANTFSGNYLGWTPVKTSDSGVTLEGYDQTVNAGATVAPAFASGLTAAQPLATAAANQGLGIAYLDARLKLLIPVTANNGVYTATLTISAL